jgi:hypothetical protein
MTAQQADAQTPEAKAAFDARWQRIMDCVRLKQPDRMPTALYCTFWLAKLGGISHRQLMYDYEKVKELGERAVLEFEPDIYNPFLVHVAAGPMLDALHYKQLLWPGHGVGDHQPFQYLDREYMKADEYDEFIDDPTGFYLRKYLPRVAGIFDGFEDFPDLPGVHYFRLFGVMRALSRPKVRAALERMFQASQEVDRFSEQNSAFTRQMASLGFPTSHVTTSISPYDLVADYFRGATGIMKDLYRNKEKLLELLDKACRFLTRQTIKWTRPPRNPIVFIPIHWAADTFMSPKQFETFWWPSFRKMMINLIEADLIPMPLWEADCTKRLEVIRDIPAGKCIYWFERTDMVRAFEVLGDVVALRGNISSSLLTTGKPEDVDGAVRHLVQKVFHKGGKLILDAAFGLPDETPVKNVRTMYSAARKYSS